MKFSKFSLLSNIQIPTMFLYLFGISSSPNWFKSSSFLKVTESLLSFSLNGLTLFISSAPRIIVVPVRVWHWAALHQAVPCPRKNWPAVLRYLGYLRYCACQVLVRRARAISDRTNCYFLQHNYLFFWFVDNPGYWQKALPLFWEGHIIYHYRRRRL